MGFSLELKGVGYSYEGIGRVLSGVGFSLEAGEVLGIISHVGGGKSTLLKIAAGIIRPQEGELLIDGVDFWSRPVPFHYDTRRRMGFDFQEAALIANMTIFQNLALPLRYHGERSEREITDFVDEKLNDLELSAFRDRLPAALSAGLRRRVSFLRAVLERREFYFWDEPTQGASSAFMATVADAITEAKGRGAGSLVATQNSSFLARVASRILVLDDGGVKFFGQMEGGRIPVAVETEGMLRE